MPPISLWLGPQKQQRERVKGLLFILAVAVIWVVASFVVQGLEEHGLDPFLLSYIANSMFLVYLPVYMLYSRYQHSRAAKVHRGGRQSDTGVEVEADTTTLVAIEPDSGRALLEPASQHQTIKAALVVAPLWFMAQYTFNLSLSITTVTSNTILSSTSSLFTFGLACVLLHERFTPFKLVFIALTTAGTAIVTLSDEANSNGRSSVAGDVLVLVSACCYASYTVALRKMLPDDENASMTLFFGLVGLLNLVCLSPVLMLLQLASYVQLTTLTSRVLLITLCKGLFDNVLSDYLWARAVLLVGPTIATVGLSIQVPLAVTAEVLFKDPTWLASTKSVLLMLCGAVFVLGGFLGINLQPQSPLGPAAQTSLASGSELADSCDMEQPGGPDSSSSFHQF